MTTKNSGHEPHDQVISGGGPDTAPLNFDDEEIYSGRAKARKAGGTVHAQGGDSAPLGPPIEELSDSNGPSDKESRA